MKSKKQVQNTKKTKTKIKNKIFSLLISIWCGQGDIFMVKTKNKQMNGDVEKVSFFLITLKGALYALSVCLIGILIFAFILRFVAVGDALIKPINQVIKTFSILIGTFVALKKSKDMGLISGLIIGLLFTIISFLAFSILDGHFEFGISLLNDCLFGSIVGGICGIIAVNLRKK